MDMPFKCPHCGSNAFRLFKGSDVLECVTCGKTGAVTVPSAFQQTRAPAKAREPSE
jgi:transcription elongation factor Elf1